MLAVLSTLSAGVGLLFLVSYLHSEGAPFPFIDPSLIVLLILITVVFAFLFAVVGFFLLLPAVLKQNPPKEARAALPGLFTEGSGFGPHVRDYLRFFWPFLLSAALSAVFPFVVQLPLLALIVLLLIVASPLIPLYFDRNREEVGLSSASMSIISLFCLLVLCKLVLLMLGVSLPNSTAYLWAVLLFVLVHFFLTFGTGWRPIVGTAVLLLLLSAVWPGPAYDGALVLQSLGLGGGAPATILVKPIGTGSSQRAAEEVSGCLIIGVGSEILIRPACCRFECSLNASGPPRPNPPTYKNVERFARGDILRVSRFFNDSSCPKK
ncbi:MAG: hypothetical protein WB676_25820 [Bryobacteraceae bacterium]